MGTPPQKKQRVSDIRLMFRRGAGRPLLLCLLGIALIPMLVLCIDADRRHAAFLEKEIPRTLRMVSALTAHDLQRFLQSGIDDTTRLAKDDRTRAFFNTLTRRYTDRGQPLKDFVESTDWATTVATFEAAIHLYAELHEYDDILLIDAGGDVIYSSARGADLSRNLNAAAYSGSPLARGVQEALATGRTRSMGFAPHPSDSGPVVAFITAAIDLDESTRAGVLACRVPASAIDRQLEAACELAEGLRLYLVDRSLSIIASGGMSPNRQKLPDGSRLPGRWRDARQDNTISTAGEPVEYRDTLNRSWTGVHEDIQANDHHWGLIVEIDNQIARTSLTGLRRFNLTVAVLTAIAAILGLVFLTRRYITPPHQLVHQLAGLSGNWGRLPAAPTTRNEIDQLWAAFDAMVRQMEKLKADNDNRILLLSGLTCLHRRISGEPELGGLCEPTLDFMAEFLGLQRAAFFIAREDGLLAQACRLPDRPGRLADNIVSPGEGLVGQAAIDQTIVAYRTDSISSLMTAVPQPTLANLIAVPLAIQHTVKGVLELQKPTVFSPSEIRFVEAAAEVITVALNTALIRQQEKRLRQDNREQARKLKMREAALEASTSELKAQKQAFQETERNLQLKHLELEAANAQMAKNAADLETNLAILEKQKRDMQAQNSALEQAHRALAEKARQLEISSRYKTEFMANMSHELRTPLNSILLLSRLLQENKEHNLSDRQIEFTRTIQAAGEDLLNLINEILDLAKVESGKLAVEKKTVAITDIADALREAFTPLAEQKGLNFAVHVDPQVPRQVTTDRKRLEQIVKNFLSNAFKFTDAGDIRLTFTLGRNSAENGIAADGGMRSMLAVSVSDTGIGIPADKQEMIFEAFQQIDGSTRREYGGTGLGLSISRELARMLGGRIDVESAQNQGSRFTLVVPVPETSGATADAPADDSRAEYMQMPDRQIPDDSTPPCGTDPTDPINLPPETPCILVIDHEPETADVIGGCIPPDGPRLLRADKLQTGMHYAEYYRPEAVFLNLALAGAGGWHAVRYIKTRLANRIAPVCTISFASDETTAILHGAAAHLSIPATPDTVANALKRLNEHRRQAASLGVAVVTPSAKTATDVAAAVGNGPLHVVHAEDGGQASHLLEDAAIGALVIDPTIGTHDIQTLATALHRHPKPLFGYPGKHAVQHLEASFHQAGMAVTLPSLGSPDQLLAALTGSLHVNAEAFAHTRLADSDALRQRASLLIGRRVLLADDDMRTVFAVSSVLEDHGILVSTGRSGKESLDKLDGFPEIDLILLDVTMAGMDDYRVIATVRHRERYRHTPIIALTAKAMAGDRARCIAAGADDYLSKPVKSEKLISMLTCWLDPLLTARDAIHQ